MLSLEEVDYGHHVEEETEPGVMYSLTIPRAAKTLALPACPEHVHWSVIGDQIGVEGGVTLIDVLQQAVLKSLEGSIRELVRELKLEFAQNRRRHASADIVLINIGVAPDLVARSQGRSKCPQSNASKQFQHMETVLQCLGSHFLDGGVDGTCVVHCLSHPGRSRVDFARNWCVGANQNN